MASSSEVPASTIRASTIPTSRKMPWAIVIVVLAMITEGTLSSSGTRSRSSQAFTTSPPRAAVGVTMLKASPARRVASSGPKGTRSWRKA